MSAHTWIEQAVKRGATVTVRTGFGGEVEAVLRWPFAPAVRATGKSLAAALEVLEFRAGDDAAGDLLKEGGA